MSKPLKVYWWQYQHPDKLNFGDELTPYIIERLFGLPTTWAEPKDCDIAGAGSIIEVLQQLSGDHKLWVWGSGFIKPGTANENKNLCFAAVRGKLSLDRIENKSAALGDPGLLASLAFKGIKARDKLYKVGIIPHYVDVETPYLANIESHQGYKVINPLDPVETVIQSITECELIVSSSLHGLIVSDSFSIPNYWIPFSDSLTGGDYKFQDYYSVFNEKPNPLSPSDIYHLDVNTLMSSYKPKDKLEHVQQNLVKSFPF